MAGLEAEPKQIRRADDERGRAADASSGSGVVVTADDPSDMLDRVRITVAGEGQLHLYGPLAGINAMTRMIHEIDQPVGEVKIGIHVAQFSGNAEGEFDRVPALLEQHLEHARQMSQTSQMLFRTALGIVAARYHARAPNRFEDTFFYGPCVQNFRSLNGSHALLSLPLLDSRDIVTTLYLVGVANQPVRREILAEFQRLVAEELPILHAQQQAAIAASLEGHGSAGTILARLAGPIARVDGNGERERRPLDLSFSHTMACLRSPGEQPDSANAIQVATARFQRAVLAFRQAEAAVAAMRNDRKVLAIKTACATRSAAFPVLPGEVLDAASFAVLADSVIEEQAARVLDLHEVVRSEVAALDGQLKRLTAAFDDDLRRQFFKPALDDLRRHASARKAQRVQIQTTTIRTHDRMTARVSPGQTAVLDQPVRPVLLQEGLQVAHGLAQEAQVLAQYGSLQVASSAVAPGAAALLAQTGVAPVPGQHLGQLVEQSERVSIAVGDEISVTPVIQPDGISVAFHLAYSHTPQRNSPAGTLAAGSVQRHLIEADVQIASLELQEVSRFRVALDATQQGPGIPLLEEIPVAGALFRPRRSSAATMQQNIILVDVVVYPTVLTLTGNNWLAVEPAQHSHAPASVASVSAPARPSDLTAWVLETLRRQAQAGLSETDPLRRMDDPVLPPTASRLLPHTQTALSPHRMRGTR
jgi:hypothetical protein